MMIPDDLLDSCRRLVDAVCPELTESAPLYFVDGAELSGLALRSGRCLLGISIPGSLPDQNLIDIIGNRWAGPGNVIGLYLDEIREAAASPATFVGCVHNVVLHEAAHLVPPPKVAPERAAEPKEREFYRAADRLRMLRCEALPEPTFDSDDNPHNSGFVRRCIHAWARSRIAGWEIPSGGLFGGDLTFASSVDAYTLALLPEVVAMQSATFAEIEATEAPQWFSQQWRADLEHKRKMETWQQ